MQEIRRRIIRSALLGALTLGTALAQSPPPAPDPTKAQDRSEQPQNGQQQPVQQQDTVHPRNSKDDVEAIGNRKVGKGPNFYSLEKETALGKQLAQEVERSSKLIDDPVVTEYVNRVGQNLVRNSDARVPFTIKVIDSDEVNAFALPGGFFYVNKGLILAADNEAELAGVMAHEIAHVCARHAMENEAKMRALDYGLLAGMILGGGIIGNVLYNTGGMVEGMAFLKFSRAAEEEADRLGVQYMWAAGYDPNAMATMFEKLEAKNKKKPGTIAKMFADHPAPADRRAAAIALAARFPERDEYVISSSEFQRVKNRLLRLSNARASSSGAIGGSDDGTPGRPTLKRRQPTPDDSTTTPDSTAKPDSTKPSAPSLKRGPEPQPTPTPQP